MTERPGRARRTIAALESDGRILPERWHDWRFGRERLQADLDAAERARAFYRKQLTLESRLGMCLERIAG